MHVTDFMFWCLFLTIKSACTQSCDYVKDLRLFYKDAGSPDWQQTYVNGCIDEAALKVLDVREINNDCKATQLRRIGPNFLNSVKSLEKLFINRCKFDTIDPGAFSNLPKLIEVNISQNSLKEIRKGVFDGLTSLNKIYLHLNEISFIEDDAFANLPNLKSIDIKDNQCDYIRKEWFTNTRGIKHFFMARNNLRQIPPRMFEGWRQLEWLDLKSNKIAIIHDRAFNDVAPIIKNLDLHLNHLTTISARSFSDHANIAVLRISGNLLNYLPEEFIKNVNLNYLYIHGNPFKCPCLERIYWLLHEKGGVYVDFPGFTYFNKACNTPSAPICVVPSRFRYCQDTVDSGVTRTYLTYLKKIGYDALHYMGEKCAMFDAL